jgi:hypothetical protein
MGLRFRRSIRLGKFLRINLSKTGASLSAGRPGATVNFGPKGKKLTVGLPGTGLSYSTKIGQRQEEPLAPAEPKISAPPEFPQRTAPLLTRLTAWVAAALLVAVVVVAIIAGLAQN